MPLKNPFKLEKLKIEAYRSAGRRVQDLVGTFTAMFNPESIRQKYTIAYGRRRAYNFTNPPVHYGWSEPRTLALKLILDGTGVGDPGVSRLGPQRSVSDRIDELIRLTFRMNGDIHEPNYLRVRWGKVNFPCRLSSIDVAYTAFHRDGTPLHAEVDVALRSDAERSAGEFKSSPDLTHSRVVRGGDTLPLLTRKVYGSPDHYLLVARFNGLDDFRDLVPGQEIFFPPLETEGAEAPRPSE
jgi:hypothetical protein